MAVPSVSVFVDLDAWDGRAAALGGNAYSLLAGFCARLADSMGRRAADGKVPLIIPINDRAGVADEGWLWLIVAAGHIRAWRPTPQGFAEIALSVAPAPQNL